MTAQNGFYGNSDTGEASNSVPLTPIQFLRTFWGKRKTVKAKGIFIDDLLNRQGKTVRSEYFIGYIAGKYTIDLDFGEVILRVPYHALAVRQLEWIEIDGQRVRSGQDE